MKKSFKLIFFFALLILPAVSEACPMCQGGPSEKTVTAYKTVTLALTLLPFILGGGIFLWVRKKRNI